MNMEQQLSQLSAPLSNTASAAVRVGDWICLICNNLNYSFRHSCNRCRVQTKSNNFYQQLLMIQQDNKQSSQVLNHQQQQPSQQYSNQQQFLQVTDQRKQIIQEQTQERYWNEIQYESHRQQQQQKQQEQLCSLSFMGQNKQDLCQNINYYVDKENVDPQLPGQIPKAISVQKLQLRQPLKQQKTSQGAGKLCSSLNYDEDVLEEFNGSNRRLEEDNNLNKLDNSNFNLPRTIIDSLQDIHERNNQQNNEKNENQFKKSDSCVETLGFFASSTKKELGTRGFEHCLYVTPPRRVHSTAGEGNSGSSSLDIESIVKKFKLMYCTTEKYPDNEKNEELNQSQNSQIMNSNQYSEQGAMITQSIKCRPFSFF